MRRYILICLATVAVVVGGAAASDWYAAKGEVLTVATSASLSISGPSFASRDQAVSYAGAIAAAGHPAYIRARAEDNRFQVLVGPFVASSEAQAAQRALARRGLAETRLFVDETLRTETATTSRWTSPPRENEPRLIVAAAPGIVTLTIEMAVAPRDVLSQRIASNLLDIEVTPTGGDFQERRWKAPQGALLLNSVILSPLDKRPDHLRVRLDIPSEAVTRVRLEGRRVYVDLAWPDPPWPVAGGAPPILQARAPAQTPGPARASAPVRAESAPPASADDGMVRDTIARFRQVKPFLLSAVEAPEPQVLAALARTLDELNGAVDDPKVKAPQLRQAIGMARDAASAEFAGDRPLQARRAIELFEAAAAPLDASTPVRQ